MTTTPSHPKLWVKNAEKVLSRGFSTTVANKKRGGGGTEGLVVVKNVVRSEEVRLSSLVPRRPSYTPSHRRLESFLSQFLSMPSGVPATAPFRYASLPGSV